MGVLGEGDGGDAIGRYADVAKYTRKEGCILTNGAQDNARSRIRTFDDIGLYSQPQLELLDP